MIDKTKISEKLKVIQQERFFIHYKGKIVAVVGKQIFSAKTGKEAKRMIEKIEKEYKMLILAPSLGISLAKDCKVRSLKSRHQIIPLQNPASQFQLQSAISFLQSYNNITKTEALKGLKEP